MSDHYTTELEENDEGWWPAKCACGAALGDFPAAEDAADALMDHAYQQGFAAAMNQNEGPTT